jgi:hypothetical protein
MALIQCIAAAVGEEVVVVAAAEAVVEVALHRHLYLNQHHNQE